MLEEVAKRTPPHPATLRLGAFEVSLFKMEICRFEVSPCGLELGFCFIFFFSNVDCLVILFWYCFWWLTLGCVLLLVRKMMWRLAKMNFGRNWGVSRKRRMQTQALRHQEHGSGTTFYKAKMAPDGFRNNLGTVYNMMRDHEKAQEYFLAAQEVAGHAEPDKNDLWNMGIAPRWNMVKQKTWWSLGKWNNLVLVRPTFINFLYVPRLK